MEDENARMAAMKAKFEEEIAQLRESNKTMREEAKRKAANRESQTKLERSRKERSLGTSFAGQGGGNAADRRGTAVSAMDSMLTRGVSTGADLGQPLQNFPRVFYRNSPWNVRHPNTLPGSNVLKPFLQTRACVTLSPVALLKLLQQATQTTPTSLASLARTLSWTTDWYGGTFPKRLLILPLRIVCTSVSPFRMP